MNTEAYKPLKSTHTEYVLNTSTDVEYYHQWNHQFATYFIIIDFGVWLHPSKYRQGLIKNDLYGSS